MIPWLLSPELPVLSIWSLIGRQHILKTSDDAMGALRQTTKTTLLLCLVALTGCGTIVRQDNSARTVVLGRVAGPSEKAATSFLPDQEAVFPTLEELRLLATHPQTEGELGGKLDTLWHTPIVSNAAAQKGQPVPVAHNDFMGPFLRFGTWNIEKSLKMDEAITALTSADGYEALVDEKAAPPESDRRQTMMRQRERLSQVDILCLQEMDIGVSRSDYVDAARRLAESMDMNLAYDIQYLEIDPALTAEADPARAKGAFGSAVLSRYPIKHVDLRPLR
ncbi:MAG: endonuclease/exonuclease/phosphatase family protein, partial [Limisphaerales bacterium]